MSDYPPPPGQPGTPGSGDPSPPPPPPPGGWSGSTPPGGGGSSPPGGGWGSPPGGGWGAPPPPPSGGGYGPPPSGYGQQFGPGPGGYSVGNAFSYAFRKFGENFLPLVLITLVLIVGAGIVQGISRIVLPQPDTANDLSGGLFGIAFILSLLFSALSFVVNLIVQSAIIKGSLELTRGRKFDLGSAFSGIDWAQVIIAALIIGVLTFVGLVLCILPGLAVIFFTSYTLYFVIDRGEDAVTAIKSSVRMVKNNVGPLLLFFLASIAALVVGACLCGVGLLAAIPIVVLAQAYTFRTLNNDPVTV